MLARFEGFHYRAACQMSGRRARRGRGNGGEWVYPPSREVRKAANLQLVSYYLGKRRARIAFDMENAAYLTTMQGFSEDAGVTKPPVLVGSGLVGSRGGGME